MKNVSIKNVLMGVVLILVAVLIVQSVKNVFEARGNSWEARRMNLANELNDHIITAAGFEAIERGLSATLLSSDKPAGANVVQKISKLRKNGDEALNKAIVVAEELGSYDLSNKVYINAFSEFKRAYADAKSARSRVDQNISRAVKDYPSSEIIKVMSNVIERGAEVRLYSLTSPSRESTLQGPLRFNAELKHAVWLASEYAGRERAVIGSFIGAGSPVSKEGNEKLLSFRAITRLHTDRLQTLKHDADADKRILASVNKMDEIFLGSFEALRQSVYAAAETGDYPVSASEWIGTATEGINSILAVSTTVSTVANELIEEETSAAKMHMAVSILFLATSLTIGIATFFIIRRKVILPMIKLNSIMSHIEQTGDLTMKADSDRRDEVGQMAKAFNLMISKFHEITRNTQASSDHLASASEQLSASAMQIASGSEEQSSRAGHVATASQEMSATVIEVAKNASGAAESAKSANETASKGSEIVASTITSMNGIAETAKESSEVIANLGDKSQEIGKIVNVIEEIADQTNLLALNAAIEAARAGEQGRGFAVVADEVRKLAERTAKATKEIGEMIGAIQDETVKAISTMDREVKVVEEGVGLAEEAGNSLREIVTQVEDVTGVIAQIATASEEQATAADQISNDIETVAGITKETTTASQQIVAASQEMAKLASSLQTAVSIFKVSGNGNKASALPLSEATPAIEAQGELRQLSN